LSRVAKDSGVVVHGQLAVVEHTAAVLSGVRDELGGANRQVAKVFDASAVVRGQAILDGQAGQRGACAAIDQEKARSVIAIERYQTTAIDRRRSRTGC